MMMMAVAVVVAIQSIKHSLTFLPLFAFHMYTSERGEPAWLAMAMRDEGKQGQKHQHPSSRSLLSFCFYHFHHFLEVQKAYIWDRSGKIHSFALPCLPFHSEPSHASISLSPRSTVYVYYVFCPKYTQLMMMRVVVPLFLSLLQYSWKEFLDSESD